MLTLIQNGSIVAFCTVCVTIRVNVFSTWKHTPQEAAVAPLLIGKPNDLLYIMHKKVRVTDTHYNQQIIGKL